MAESLPIDGVWQLVRAEHQGEIALDEVVERTTIELVGGGYAVRFAGEIVDRGRFELGGVADARTLLLHGLAGPNAGRTIPCLYQLRGDRLRVCFGFDGVAPTEFSTSLSNRRYLATYSRKTATLAKP